MYHGRLQNAFPGSAWTPLALLLLARLVASTLPPQHTVSGLSSGGDMAVNHLVAFSGSTVGAAIVAGAPYGCNILEGDRDVCGSDAPLEPWKKLLPRLEVYMLERQAAGLIDPLANLQGRPVYLFSGASDVVVRRDTMRAVKWQLGALVGVENIKVDFNLGASHGWIVDDSQCGASPPGEAGSWCAACCCTPSDLLACAGHDLAGRLLQHLWGDALLSRGAPRLLNGSDTEGNYHWLKVPQEPYVPRGRTLKDVGMWHTAYIYAPWWCRGDAAQSCVVHVHYHGCAWGAEYLGMERLNHLGFKEWADIGGIVLVFPQASSTVDSSGCWDWTGETGHHFDTHQGVQLRTVMALLEDLPRILGVSSAPTLI